MRIGALQRFTLVDYPGKVAAIVFTQGCEFRCPYCYNRELVLPEFYEPLVPEAEVLAFLRARRGQLDALVVTGGEPTLQEDLAGFLRKVKDLGYTVKLDTNGSRPETIGALIKEGLVDYIAMDVKAPPAKYREVTRANIDAETIQRSLDLIEASGVDYEFRTTVVREQLTPDDILAIGRWVQGAKRYVLQRFQPTDTMLDPSFKTKTNYSDSELQALKAKLQAFVSDTQLR